MAPSTVGPAIAVFVLALIVSLASAIGSRDPGSASARTLNVNAATASELSMLPGVGPVLAARIIEKRESEGPFRAFIDLDEVRGIGPRTLARIEPYVAFGEGAGFTREDRP
ncbi:MAG: helix-hairpin-helix domain-containing protein [Planctomycetota bacterium]